MIYITGDTHGRFDRIAAFCSRIGTKREDVLIVLGDAGINYYGDHRDTDRKNYIDTLPITLFCIHGNHEQRPATLPQYREMEWHGGMVYREDAYPNILFGKDGEIHDLDGLHAIVIGGAYSVDKFYRIASGYGWWADEQPSDEQKRRVEMQLADLDWKVDVVLSHTAPLKYEPVEAFMEGVDQSRVDKSTEKWLDGIENRLAYEKWYCAHYHLSKRIDRMEIMYENFEVFSNECAGPMEEEAQYLYGLPETEGYETLFRILRTNILHVLAMEGADPQLVFNRNFLCSVELKGRLSKFRILYRAYRQFSCLSNEGFSHVTSLPILNQVIDQASPRRRYICITAYFLSTRGGVPLVPKEILEKSWLTAADIAACEKATARFVGMDVEELWRKE